MAFSGALTITDLDDFLTPSQACIIPVRNGKAQSDLPTGETEIQIDTNNNYYEVSTYSTAPTAAAGPGPSTAERNERRALEKAEINLNDCLACSGCITSTESLLITLQSQTEVISFISNSISSSASESRTPIISISPQTLASLSAAYSIKRRSNPIPLLVLLRRIRHFLSAPERGGWQVWDTTFARHLSLRESVLEFEERQAFAKGNWVDKGGAAPVPKPGPLPMLASACPGWVCYAEKAQGDLLPLLSAARSSQAVSGALAKEWWASQTGKSPKEIYHVSAMPCYDKKLEASRSDFYSAIHETRDIDCVLTTGELDLLLSELGFDPFAPTPLDPSSTSTFTGPSTPSTSPFPELLQHPGTVSGSYLHTLIHSISSSHPSPTSLHIRKIRDSPDNEEYILYDTSTGIPVFKGAKVYGFRNLQNLVRKVGKETGLGKGKGAGKLAAAVAARRRKARTGNGEVGTPGTGGSATPGYAANGSGTGAGAGAGLDIGKEMERMKLWDEKKTDFVEVMACPSGCVNGGGQMKPVQPDQGPEGNTEGVETIGTGNGFINGNGNSNGSVNGDGNSNGIPNGTVNGSGKMEGGMEVDEEGYPRPLPDDGVASMRTALAMDVDVDVGAQSKPLGQESEEGWRWSTKEWVSKVEDVYWNHTGVEPDSGGDGGTSSGPGSGAGYSGLNERDTQADQMAEQVVLQMSGGDEVKRWELLRTRFRKVEGDVLGGGAEGGVTLEAVKW